MGAFPFGVPVAQANTVSIVIRAVDEASKALEQVRSQVEGLDQAGAKASGGGLARTQQEMRAIATVSAGVAAAIAGAGIALGRSAIRMAADMEQTNVAFTTLLRSADTAKIVLGDIQKLAALTPFEFPELADAGRNLAAFGIDAASIAPTLQRIGDVASGINQPIGEIAEIYGKAKVQGRLFMEDINQLTGRGIPIIGELAKQFGVAESQVRGLVEKGQIGFGNLSQAFTSMTSEGGSFFEMMKKQSGTAAGMWSTLTDNVGALARSFGEMLLPVVKAVLGWLIQLTDAVANMDPQVRNLTFVVGAAATAFVGLRAAAVAFAAFEGPLKTVLLIIGTSIKAMLGPIGLVIAAVGALYVAYQTNFLGIGDAVRNAADWTGLQLSRVRDFFAAVIGNLDTLSFAFSEIFSSIGYILEGFSIILYGRLVEPFLDVYNSIATALTETAKTIGQWVTTVAGLFQPVVDFLRDLGVSIGNGIQNIGEQAISGLTKMITTSRESLVDAAENVLATNATVAKGFGIVEREIGNIETVVISARASISGSFQQIRDASTQSVADMGAASAAAQAAYGVAVPTALDATSAALDKAVSKGKTVTDVLDAYWKSLDNINTKEAQLGTSFDALAEQLRLERQVYDRLVEMGADDTLLQQFSQSILGLERVIAENELTIKVAVEYADAELAGIIDNAAVEDELLQAQADRQDAISEQIKQARLQNAQEYAEAELAGIIDNARVENELLQKTADAQQARAEQIKQFRISAARDYAAAELAGIQDNARLADEQLVARFNKQQAYNDAELAGIVDNARVVGELAQAEIDKRIALNEQLAADKKTKAEEYAAAELSGIVDNARVENELLQATADKQDALIQQQKDAKLKAQQEYAAAELAGIADNARVENELLEQRIQKEKDYQAQQKAARDSKATAYGDAELAGIIDNANVANDLIAGYLSAVDVLIPAIRAEVEARQKALAMLITVTRLDAPIAAFGKSLLNLAVNEIPLVGTIFNNLAFGPLAAIMAVFRELFSKSSAFGKIIAQVSELLAPLAEIIGLVLTPPLKVLGAVLGFVTDILYGIANALIDAYNFLLGWLFGRVDKLERKNPNEEGERRAADEVLKTEKEMEERRRRERKERGGELETTKPAESSVNLSSVNPAVQLAVSIPLVEAAASIASAASIIEATFSSVSGANLNGSFARFDLTISRAEAMYARVDAMYSRLLEEGIRVKLDQTFSLEGGGGDSRTLYLR